MPTAEGNLTWEALSERPDIVAAPVAAAAAVVPQARVAEIDPPLADTATFCEAYDVAPDASANCVVVFGRRGEESTFAAGPVVIGGGARHSKLPVDGAALAGLPGARVLPLAIPTP